MNARQLVSALMLCCMLGMAAGCAVSGTPRAEPRQIVGLWQGQIRSGCEAFRQPDPGRCNAINRTTFSIEEKDGGLRGSYGCEAGNAPCRNLADGGNIVHGEVSGKRVSLRVFIPADGSSCTYSGRLQDDAVRGGFTCTQGAAIVDSGSWEMLKVR